MFFEIEPDIFGMLVFSKNSPALYANPMTQKKICAVCGLSFADIAKTGKAGCAKCYEKFESELVPTIVRIHGTVKHTGKIPKSKSARLGAKRKIETLNIKMQQAVAEQNFEEAAVIRDEINKIKEV